MIDTALTNDTDSKAISSANWLTHLTVADGLLILTAVTTAVSRFTNLGHIPLAPDEAAQAWASWQFWQPGSAIVTTGSPAYFSLTSLLLPLLGNSDAVMRLIPALFGLGITLLPWFLRRQLGTVGALVASLLLAVSPTQAIVGRTAGGDAIALSALLLMVVAGLRYETESDSRWLTALFAGLALGLASSPLFYGGLAALALVWFDRWRSLFSAVERAMWRKTAVSAALFFLALSSLFLWHLPGLGMAATLPADWLGWFRFSGPGLFDPLLALLRYEPFLVLVGGTAVFWAIRSDNRLAKQFIGLAAGALALMLLQRGQMGNVALFTLPCALLVGLMADDLLQTRPSNLGWAWAGGLFLLAGLVLVNLARFVRVINFDPQDFTSAWIILMAVTAGLVTVFFLSSLDMTAVTQGAFLGLLAVFIFYQWGVGWQLTHVAANDPRERWVTTATDDDVRLLSSVLQDISRQATNSDHELDIFSSVDTPVLRWYLRDFSRVQFGASLPVGAQNDVLISPDQSDLALGSDYAGADFGLVRTGLQPRELPSPTPVLDWLRWQMFHESSLAIAEERVILWWRVDLSN